MTSTSASRDGGPGDPRRLLSNLPQVERLLHVPAIRASAGATPRSLVLDALRGVVSCLRRRILAGEVPPERMEEALAEAEIARLFAAELRRRGRSAYRRAVNATGIILHTGLGRAVLPPAALEALRANLGGYSVVEVDLETGERNQREAALAALLQELTGAEAATVVNNNAAATLIILAALARGREVVIARGQLVEIGGSFRIPDILKESGARLVEVGTTNRTYIDDYRRAIGPDTGLLLQVHTSNYEIVGFAHHTPLADLVALGRERGIPVVSDLGSGCFVDLARAGFRPEPLVADRVRAGADLVCFSGDKLLGGPQAGVIAGRSEHVRRVRAHPLFRALRIDKVSLTLLEATLRAYRDPETLAETIPVHRLIGMSEAEVEERARGAAEAIRALGAAAEVEAVPSSAQAGSGSLPAQEIRSWAVAVSHPRLPADEIARLLRLGAPPILARIQDGRVLLDFRTVLPGEEAEVASAVKALG
jgi:L-seryl-tRNA(Ser) seleniumtransferase